MSNEMWSQSSSSCSWRRSAAFSISREATWLAQFSMAVSVPSSSLLFRFLQNCNTEHFLATDSRIGSKCKEMRFPCVTILIGIVAFPTAVILMDGDRSPAQSLAFYFWGPCDEDFPCLVVSTPAPLYSDSLSVLSGCSGHF